MLSTLLMEVICNGINCFHKARKKNTLRGWSSKEKRSLLQFRNTVSILQKWNHGSLNRKSFSSFFCQFICVYIAALIRIWISWKQFLKAIFYINPFCLFLSLYKKESLPRLHSKRIFQFSTFWDFFISTANGKCRIAMKFIF